MDELLQFYYLEILALYTKGAVCFTLYRRGLQQNPETCEYFKSITLTGLTGENTISLLDSSITHRDSHNVKHVRMIVHFQTCSLFCGEFLNQRILQDSAVYSSRDGLYSKALIFCLIVRFTFLKQTQFSLCFEQTVLLTVRLQQVIVIQIRQVL